MIHSAQPDLGTSGNRTIVWSCVALAIALNAAGWFLGWFETIAWWDDVTHGFTSFAVTLAFGLFLYGRSLPEAGGHSIAIVVTLAMFGVGLGAVWEIAEWSYDHLAGPRNTIRGKTETILDLIWDACGALVAAIAVAWAAHRSRDRRA